jgi:hypothetical protein
MSDMLNEPAEILYTRPTCWMNRLRYCTHVRHAEWTGWDAVHTSDMLNEPAEILYTRRWWEQFVRCSTTCHQINTSESGSLFDLKVSFHGFSSVNKVSPHTEVKQLASLKSQSLQAKWDSWQLTRSTEFNSRQRFLEAFAIKSCRNAPVTSPCLSVRLIACQNSRTSQRIFTKFDIGQF